MGKNKRQLIVNNDLIREFMTNVETYLPDFKEPEDLEPEVSEQEDILAEIMAVLPYKGAGGNDEDVVREINAQPAYVDAIIAELSKKALASSGEGQYVWSKYNYIPPYEVDTSFTVLETNKIKFNTPNIPIELLVGKVIARRTQNSADTIKIISTTQYTATYSSSTDTAGFTYDQATGELKFNSNSKFSITSSLDLLSYTVTIPLEVTSFIDYVISTEANTYPNGGILGEYWYDSSAILPMRPQFTKFAIDKITFTSRSASTSTVFNHSLGVPPKLGMILASNYETKTESDILYVTFVHEGVAGNNGIGAHLTRTSINTGITNGYCPAVDVTDTTLRCGSYEKYYTAGVEYTIITIA